MLDRYLRIALQRMFSSALVRRRVADTDNLAYELNTSMLQAWLV